MAYWKEIEASRYASGKLWLPQLSLDMMGRDWSLVTVPLELRSVGASRGSPGSVTRDLSFFLPDTWGIDTAFSAGMYAVLHLPINVTVAAATLGEYSLTGGPDVSVNGPVSAEERILNRVWTGTLPTGLQTLTLELVVTGGGGASASWTRSIGSHGPNAWLEIAG